MAVRLVVVVFMRPLSFSLNTLSLSRSEMIEEPRSVMLSARLLAVCAAHISSDETLLCGLIDDEELGDEDDGDVLVALAVVVVSV